MEKEAENKIVVIMFICAGITLLVTIVLNYLIEQGIIRI